MNRLINMGFNIVGSWKLDGADIEFILHASADARNILYSFVCDGSVLYVGKTIQPLRKRMYGYQKPGPTQSTNIRGNKNIRQILLSGKQVDIYALPDNGLLHFGGFHVNLAAGLEDSIVNTLRPPWNMTGKLKA